MLTPPVSSATASAAWLSPGWGPPTRASWTSIEAGARRLAEGPAGFSLHVQLAEAGDPTYDSTRSWPSDRSEIVAGRLEVTAPVDDPLAGCERAIFDPTRVTAGIECSNDPVLNFRARAYSVSYERRSH